jgi:flagellar secretion chaperone FliS
MTNNPFAKIQQNSILTASPQELTLMLYNGAIKFTNQAIEAIKKKDMALAHEKIIRVEDIIQEFIASLDHQYAVAEDMKRMYDYIYSRLIEANIQKDSEILEEVNVFLREFRDTWKEAIDLLKQPEKQKQAL